jgi:hypothetical protein
MHKFDRLIKYVEGGKVRKYQNSGTLTSGSIADKITLDEWE